MDLDLCKVQVMQVRRQVAMEVETLRPKSWVAQRPGHEE